MICYKDKTFCSYFQDCAHRKECKDKLTHGVKSAAERTGLLISQWSEKPGCWERIDQNEKASTSIDALSDDPEFTKLANE
jgi:hypothetical protein